MIPNVMGIADIAARLGVSRSRADQLSREREFPLPVGRINRGAVWSRAEIEQWIKTHRKHT